MKGTFSSITIDGRTFPAIGPLELSDPIIEGPALRVSSFEFTFDGTAEAFEVLSSDVLAKALNADLAARFTENGYHALAAALERGDLKVVGYNGDEPSALEWTLAWANLKVFDYAFRVELQRLAAENVHD